jgi:hypothetical protein
MPSIHVVLVDPRNDSVGGVQASLNSSPGSIGTLQLVSYLGLLYKELVGMFPQASGVIESNTLCMEEGALNRIFSYGFDCFCHSLSSVLFYHDDMKDPSIEGFSPDAFLELCWEFIGGDMKSATLCL